MGNLNFKIADYFNLTPKKVLVLSLDEAGRTSVI
jgi:hypothetical protein